MRGIRRESAGFRPTGSRPEEILARIRRMYYKRYAPTVNGGRGPGGSTRGAEAHGVLSMRAEIELFLSHLETERNLSPHTLKSYRTDILQLHAYLDEAGILSLGDVDHLVIREFLARIRSPESTGKERTASTLARKISALRTYFRFLQSRLIIRNDPLSVVRSPRRRPKLPAFLSEEEMDRLLETPSGQGFGGTRDRAILEMLYSAGLRVSELTGVNLTDLHLREGYLRIRGKGRRERLGMLGQEAMAAIERYSHHRRGLLAKHRIEGEEALFLNLRTIKAAYHAIGTETPQEIPHRRGPAPRYFSPCVEALLRHPLAQ